MLPVRPQLRPGRVPPQPDALLMAWTRLTVSSSGWGQGRCGLGSWGQKCLNPAAGLCDDSSLEGIGHVRKISSGRARSPWNGLESGQLHFYVHFRKESVSAWLPGNVVTRATWLPGELSHDIPTNTPSSHDPSQPYSWNHIAVASAHSIPAILTAVPSPSNIKAFFLAVFSAEEALTTHLFQY